MMNMESSITADCVKNEASGRMQKGGTKVEEENLIDKSVAEKDELGSDAGAAGTSGDGVKRAPVSRSTMRRKKRAAREKLLKEEQKKQQEEEKEEEIPERVVATRATLNRGRWAGGAMRGSRAGSAGGRAPVNVECDININIFHHRVDPLELMMMHMMRELGSRSFYSDWDSD